MGKIVASVFFCFCVLGFYCVLGMSTTLPGFVGAALVAVTTFAAADLAVYLWRNPLKSVAKRMLESKMREPGVMLMMIGTLIAVALPASAVIWSWANLYPVAFVTARHAPPITAGEALRLGFVAATLDGLLWLIKAPFRFGGLFRELITNDDR